LPIALVPTNASSASHAKAEAWVIVRAMSRPTRFEDNRYLGDKRNQVVYDLDATDDETTSRVAELVASQQFAAFGPDSLAEARNRGYRPFLADTVDD
jgi:hypothetical protein